MKFLPLRWPSRWLYPFVVAAVCLSTWHAIGNGGHSEVSESGETITRQPCVNEEAKLCARPLVEFKQRFRTARKYHLMGCAIEKNFSTLLTAILCFLHNEVKFRKSGRSLLNEDFHHRFCGSYNEHTNLTVMEFKFGINRTESRKWKYIAITRDPFDRFVSGFVDKCLKEQSWKKYPIRCCGCKTNLTCFMEKMYDRIMQRSRENAYRTSFDDDHFFPQNWRCQFNQYLHHYSILRFDSAHPNSFYDQLYGIFRGNGVSDESIGFINATLQTGRTEHSTQTFSLRQQTETELRNSPYLMDLFVKMYYFDYTLFGFPIPLFRVAHDAS